MAAEEVLVEDNPGITYAEVRFWIVFLRRFTIHDITVIAAIDYHIAERFVYAAMWHGIVTDVGETSDGDTVWEWIPLPKGPRNRPKRTPVEVLIGYTEVLMRRGMPVRLVDSGKRGSAMQVSGGRRRLKERERRYQRMIEAQEKRAVQDRLRMQKLKEAGKLGKRKAGKYKNQELEELKGMTE